MSLYRQYRPQNFADVVGQDHIVTTFEKALNQDKLAHAYLFAGSRGTGKTSVARILAKMIMTKGIEDDALKGQIMTGVEQGSVVDLLEIDAASNRGIDDIRDIVEKIQFSPVVASAKVYIIDEVHMLTKEAFNALLKTLEEPPAYAYFILATTEINKIPTTIQSRCQTFPFRRIREEEIVRRLQFIADQEHISIDREALRSIAHYVQGGMRDAISLLDQLRILETITSEDVQQRIGSTGQEYIEGVLDALQSSDAEKVLANVAQIEDAGVAMDVFMRQLLSVIRRQMHKAIEDGQSIDTYVHIMDVLLKAIADVRIAPVPALVLEAALLSLCGSGSGTEIREIREIRGEAPGEVVETKKSEKKERAIEEIEAIEEIKEIEDVAASPTPAVTSAVEEKSESSAVVEAQELSFDALQSSWGNIVNDVSPASVKMSLKNGRVQGLENETVTIAFASGFHRDTVAKDNASIRVEEVLEKYFKRALRIECVLDTNGESVETPEEDVNLADAAAEVF